MLLNALKSPLVGWVITALRSASMTPLPTGTFDVATPRDALPPAPAAVDEPPAAVDEPPAAARLPPPELPDPQAASAAAAASPPPAAPAPRSTSRRAGPCCSLGMETSREEVMHSSMH